MREAYHGAASEQVGVQGKEKHERISLLLQLEMHAGERKQKGA